MRGWRQVFCLGSIHTYIYIYICIQREQDKGEARTGELVVAAAPERAGGTSQPSTAGVSASAPPSRPAAAASGQQHRVAGNNGASGNNGESVAAPLASPQPPEKASTASATRQAPGAPGAQAAGNCCVEQGTPDTSREGWRGWQDIVYTVGGTDLEGQTWNKVRQPKPKLNLNPIPQTANGSGLERQACVCANQNKGVCQPKKKISVVDLIVLIGK